MYAKLHVQAKKSPFWIFHWVHDVPLSLPYCVKKFPYFQPSKGQTPYREQVQINFGLDLKSVSFKMILNNI